MLLHGVADNRIGVLEHALILLPAGYNVVMMDARAHGESVGAMATYGWIERHDTQAIVDALEASEHPRHLFALGESMGAGIALQSAAIDPRIEAVVAEASFANLREASYDYAGLRGVSQWFGWKSETPIYAVTFTGPWAGVDGLQIVRIPEPTSAVMLCLSAITFLLRRRPTSHNRV